MNNEKISFILRIIVYLLCAILLMEVILFAGITAFADSENVFIPSEAQLNVRLRTIGSLESAPNVGSFVTGFMAIPSDATHLYIKSPYLMKTTADSKLGISNSASFPIDYSVSTIHQGIIWTYENGVYKIDLFNYTTGSVSRKAYVVFNWYFDSSEGITNVTIDDVSQFKMNFTGDFTENSNDISPIDYLSAFADKIYDFASPLTESLYVNGDFTIYGKVLFTLCGVGIGCAIIKLIFHLFGGKK